MKPAKSKQVKKIKQEDLRKEPAWLKGLTERAKESRLAQMTEEELGQYTEELAARGAKRRQAQESTP